MDLVIYGLINAAQFILYSLGFTLIYGVSRVANFAHGAVYVLAGFGVWTFLKVGLNYPLAVILAVTLSALLGIGIYQTVLVRVRGIPASEVIASFAFGMGVIELLKMLGFVGAFGNPVFLRGSLELAHVPIDYQRVFVVATAASTVLFVYILTHHTKAGLALRGIAQDEHAAMLLGINSDRSATVSLAIGSGLAGVAAVVLLPLGDIYPGMGYEVLTYAVAVSIVGGLGSLGGTVLASILLSFIQVLTVRFLGGQWRMVVIFLAILVILIFKPSGLFGRQKELEERV